MASADECAESALCTRRLGTDGDEETTQSEETGAELLGDY